MLALGALLSTLPWETPQWQTPMMFLSGSATIVRLCGERSQGDVGCGIRGCAGGWWHTSLHFTSTWWAPQQGGHSNICLRWGLASWWNRGIHCWWARQTLAQQLKRYGKSQSYEHKDTTPSPYFSALTQNLAARLVVSWLQLSLVQLCIHINTPAHP